MLRPKGEGGGAVPHSLLGEDTPFSLFPFGEDSCRLRQGEQENFNQIQRIVYIKILFKITNLFVKNRIVYNNCNLFYYK